MDEFGGSARKAGSLNAILGRSVFNSIDLLGKTEAQRVETIVQGIRKSTNVQALSRNKFQLKAVASGLGLTVDETRKLLSGQMTVDQALARKKSEDPREAAMAKMADLLNKHVNPGFEFFVKQLDKMRTATARAGVAANFEQRRVLRQMLEGTGIETPADLFIDAERALENLAAQGTLLGPESEFKERLEMMSEAEKAFGSPIPVSPGARAPPVDAASPRPQRAKPTKNTPAQPRRKFSFPKMGFFSSKTKPRDSTSGQGSPGPRRGPLALRRADALLAPRDPSDPRITLVLDLDETLVHSRFVQPPLHQLFSCPARCAQASSSHDERHVSRLQCQADGQLRLASARTDDGRTAWEHLLCRRASAHSHVPARCIEMVRGRRLYRIAAALC